MKKNSNIIDALYQVVAIFLIFTYDLDKEKKKDFSKKKNNN